MGVVRFGLLGFKVQIQPGFWLVALFLLLTTQRDVAHGVVLVAIVFASILAHELGHAVVARRGGFDPVITIHAFGGLTSWQPNVPVTRGRAIAIALAGPGMGLILFALAVAALQLFPSAATNRSLAVFANVNGFWSVINLLPVVPFDGGLVLAQLLGPNRRSLAMHVSLAAGLLAAVLLLYVGLPVVGILIGFSAVTHFIGLSRSAERAVELDARDAARCLADAQRALENEDALGASKSAELVYRAANVSLELRRQAAEVVAWAALTLERPQTVAKVLDWLSATGTVDPLLVAATLEKQGQSTQAADHLRRALTLGDQRPQLAASLVRLLLSDKRYAEAALTTIEILDHVSVEEARLVARACHKGCRPVPAAELFMALFAETQDIEDLAWALSSYRESHNDEAFDAALAIAREYGVCNDALLRTQAFSTEPRAAELRGLISAPGSQAAGVVQGLIEKASDAQ